MPLHEESQVPGVGVGQTQFVLVGHCGLRHLRIRVLELPLVLRHENHWPHSAGESCRLQAELHCKLFTKVNVRLQVLNVVVVVFSAA